MRKGQEFKNSFSYVADQIGACEILSQKNKKKQNQNKKTATTRA